MPASEKLPPAPPRLTRLCSNASLKVPEAPLTSFLTAGSRCEEMASQSGCPDLGRMATKFQGPTRFGCPWCHISRFPLPPVGESDVRKSHRAIGPHGDSAISNCISTCPTPSPLFWQVDIDPIEPPNTKKVTSATLPASTMAPKHTWLHSDFCARWKVGRLCSPPLALHMALVY